MSIRPFCRTDLKDFILDLLDFVDEKIAEAEQHPQSRAGAIAEAAGALPLIKDRLRRDDQTLLTQFILTGIFDVDFERLKTAGTSDFSNSIREMRERIETLRAAP
jgi:hypothetical protein